MEMWFVVRFVQRICIVLLGALLYSYAGREGTSKVWRRFVASACLVGLSVWTFSCYDSINWVVIICAVISYALYAVAFSLGYGGDTIGEKIVKRLKCGIAIWLAGLPIVIVYGMWWLWLLQFIFATSSSIILGVTNPLEASEEEGLICLSSTCFFPFYFIS